MKYIVKRKNNFTNVISSSFFLFLFFVLSVSLHGNVYAQTPEQIKFYSERIKFGTDEVKRNALHDLRNFETKTASRIALPALKDKSAVIRATATHSVVFLPKNEATLMILNVLIDSSPFVRREAAYALGKVGNPHAIESLKSHLIRDKDREVQTACAVALGQIGDPKAIPLLTSILNRKPKKKEEFLRRASARAIGNIAMQLRREKKPIVTPESFLPETHKKLERIKPLPNADLFPIFYNANISLVSILRNKKETNDVRREAAFALGEIGDKSSINHLKANLNSEDYYLAEICKESLRKIYQITNIVNSNS